MREVIKQVVDDAEFLEVQENWARNMVDRLRPHGRDQHRHRRERAVGFAGTLDNNSSIKAARFVRFCDSFNIPIVTLVDVPGYLPSAEQESTAWSATRPSCCTPIARPRRPK